MDSKVSYSLVGLFVIILSTALLASILWLSSGTEQKIYTTYQAYMRESVSGLNKNAAVKYRGVEVGQVREISLEANRPDEVRLLLSIERGTPLSKDTVATLSTQGLTGIAYVELKGGSANAPLPERQEGQPYPEIKTQPSLLVRLDTAFSGLLQNLDSVSNIASDLLVNLKSLSDTAKILLSEENHRAIIATLHNLETLSNTLVKNANIINNSVVYLSEILQNSVKVTQQLSDLIGQSGQTLNHLNSGLASIENTANAFTRTADTVTSVMQDSRQNVAQTTATISQVVGNVDAVVKQSRQDLTLINRDITYFSTQALPEITRSLQELRDLLNTLRNFSQQLERKPNMILFGKSKPATGPGEK